MFFFFILFRCHLVCRYGTRSKVRDLRYKCLERRGIARKIDQILVGRQRGQYLGRAVAVSEDLNRLARRRSLNCLVCQVIEIIDPLNKGRDVILSNIFRVIVEVELLALGRGQIDTGSTAAELGAPAAAQVHVVAQIEQGEGYRVSSRLNCVQPAETVLSRRVHEEQRSKLSLTDRRETSLRVSWTREWHSSRIALEADHHQVVLVRSGDLVEGPSVVLCRSFHGRLHSCHNIRRICIIAPVEDHASRIGTRYA